ncbi:MAG: hypothetical protein QOG64_2705 [Acidimicrobiaceae bacterium]|nr:hypothetical protein [Acidimicrobiaceae bacterium]
MRRLIPLMLLLLLPAAAGSEKGEEGAGKACGPAPETAPGGVTLPAGIPVPGGATKRQDACKGRVSIRVTSRPR